MATLAAIASTSRVAAWTLGSSRPAAAPLRAGRRLPGPSALLGSEARRRGCCGVLRAALLAGRPRCPAPSHPCRYVGCSGRRDVSAAARPGRGRRGGKRAGRVGAGGAREARRARLASGTAATRQAWWTSSASAWWWWTLRQLWRWPLQWGGTGVCDCCWSGQGFAFLRRFSGQFCRYRISSTSLACLTFHFPLVKALTSSFPELCENQHRV